MLSEIFYWILNISIIGSVCGLIIMALRKIKKLPRFAVYTLWLVPLIRLWIPFGVASKYSLLSLVSLFTTKTVVVWQELPELTITNSIMSADSYFPLEYKTDLLSRIYGISSVIWIVVALACIISSLALYLFTKTELENAVHIKENIYTSDKITSPAVYGIIKPKIIIPAGIAEGDTEYIVIHERVHIRRKDNFWRVVAVVTACVHWFNPLIWIFLKYFFADAELACDNKVLKDLDESRSKGYATAVLTASRGKAFFASAFGGAKTRVRIENILSYKKLTLVSTLCFTALIIAIAVVLITNAAY